MLHKARIAQLRNLTQNRDMIYHNKERAQEVAAELTAVKGYAPAYAVRVAEGWTVIRSYRHPGELHGTLEVA